MISALKTSDFKKRLVDNTVQGDPYVKNTSFAPLRVFYKVNKIFYGVYSDSSFTITLNSTFGFALFILQGSYKQINEKETEVNFWFKRSWYGKLFCRFLIPLFLVFINIILLLQSLTLGLFLIIDFIILIPISFFLLLKFYERRILIRHFIGMFDIKKRITTANK